MKMGTTKETRSMVVIILVLLLVTTLVKATAALNYRPPPENARVYKYDRDMLLKIRDSTCFQPIPNVNIPRNCRVQHRHRGRRAGVRVRARRRKYKPPVPSVIFGNARSLVNKVDEMLRSDRTEASGKQRGGGVLLYINDRWCNNITMKKIVCTPDLELLTVSLRPFYLPREFTNIFMTIFYIPPDANRDCATAYRQYVDCSTRGEALLDPCFVNIKDAYKCKKLPPIARSDHSMLLMVPSYRTKLKQSKPKNMHSTIIDDTALENLQACWDLTDWDMFIEDAGGNVNEIAEVVTSYINFCCNLHSIVKTRKIYPNNKPWVSSNLRQLIVEKHHQYGDPLYRVKQRELDRQIKEAKSAYKEKIEQLFKNNNTKDAWKGLKILTGINKAKKDPAALCESGAANRLNTFYSRFDDKDFAAQHCLIREELRADTAEFQLDISDETIQKSLRKIKVRKSPGPDKISGKVIRSCRDSLFPIIKYIFTQSISTGVFPSVWKLGEIVPVAKRDIPREDNDFRPVTLTSILSKCLERVGLECLMPYVDTKLDPYQFAYVHGRATDDAICTLVHKICKHLDDKSSHTARALFIDYSSAFNTIQPHLMIAKLQSMHIPTHLQMWILDFLTSRPQYVRTPHELSELRVLNTGAPQGCVLSPTLFSLYTNDMTWNTDAVFIAKYADDTVVVGLVRDDNDDEYFSCIDYVSKWCSDNFLDLNVDKTKEVQFDFRKRSLVKRPVVIDNVQVAVSDSYKYLGVVIDGCLSFKDHVGKQVVKAQKKLYCVRTMCSLNVDPNIVCLFYNATIASVLLYACTAFFGMLTMALRTELERPRKWCKRLLRRYDCCNMLSENTRVFEERSCNLAKKIQKCESHPLAGCFELLPSGRRFRVPRVRTKRFQGTFIPSVIKLLNE